MIRNQYSGSNELTSVYGHLDVRELTVKPAEIN